MNPMNNLKTALRGYDQRQVDALLKEQADQIGALKAQLQFKENELEKIRAELTAFREREGGLGEALLMAQKAAEEAVANGNREAARIVQEAKQKTEDTIKESKAALEAVKWDLERLRLDKQNFINNFRTLLEGHLRELAEANRGLSVIQGDAAEAKPEPDDAAQA